jgi:hypothetical protein
MGPIARHALDLLVDEGGLDLPVTRWPLPHAAVARALDRMPRPLAPTRASAPRCASRCRRPEHSLLVSQRRVVRRAIY